MKHITVIHAAPLRQTKGAGCGECRVSCQSACKTSCTVANQKCENRLRRRKTTLRNPPLP